MATIFRPPLVAPKQVSASRQPDGPPNLLLTTLLSKDALFGAAGETKVHDWPLPRNPPPPPDARGFLNATALNLLGKDVFFAGAGRPPSYDWPPPPPRPPQLPSLSSQQVPNLLLSTLIVPVGKATDWVAKREPSPPPDSRGFLNGVEIQLGGKDQFFAAPGQPPTYSWPGTPRPADPLPTYPPNLLVGLLARPFAQTDWPPPRNPVPPPEARGFLNAAEIHLIGKDQFFGAPGQPVANDWPPPPPRPSQRPSLDSQQVPNLLPGALAVPVGKATDWVAKREPIPPPDSRGFLGAVAIQLVGLDRFFGATGQGPVYHWPPPPVARPSIPDAPIPNLTLATLGVTAPKPFAQADWPAKREPPPVGDQRGSTGNVPLNLIGKDAFFGAAGERTPADWPAPLAARRPALADLFPNLSVGTLARPVGQAATDGGPIARRPTATFDPPNLLAATLGAPMPFRLSDWPPAGAASARPGGFVGPVRLNLIGRDQFFGPPGLAPAYHWPPPATRFDPAAACYPSPRTLAVTTPAPDRRLGTGLAVASRTGTGTRPN
jgi:hypothetical protein